MANKRIVLEMKNNTLELPNVINRAVDDANNFYALFYDIPTIIFCSIFILQINVKYIHKNNRVSNVLKELLCSTLKDITARYNRYLSIANTAESNNLGIVHLRMGILLFTMAKIEYTNNTNLNDLVGLNIPALSYLLESESYYNKALSCNFDMRKKINRHIVKILILKIQITLHSTEKFLSTQIIKNNSTFNRCIIYYNRAIDILSSTDKDTKDYKLLAKLNSVFNNT
jgi:hypothetical protein